jgi:hypothetical protein
MSVDGYELFDRQQLESTSQFQLTPSQLADPSREESRNNIGHHQPI